MILFRRLAAFGKCLRDSKKGSKHFQDENADGVTLRGLMGVTSSLAPEKSYSLLEFESCCE